MLGRSGNEARSVVPARPFAKLHTHLLSTGTSRLGHCGGSWLFTSSAVSDRTGSTRQPASAWWYWQGLFDWRGALVVVQPATMIRWHRAGWRLL